MSAIDALTNTTNAASAISSLSNNKKNLNVDFNTLLAEAMKPGLPGVENSNDQAQYMLQLALLEKMQTAISTLEKYAANTAANTPSADTNNTTVNKGE